MNTHPLWGGVVAGFGAIGVAALFNLAAANTSASQGMGDALRYEKVLLKMGDRCIVSNLLLDEHGLAFLYRGRRVTLDAAHVQTFFDQPMKYFSNLQPRGALFQEDAIRKPPKRIGWFIFGVWMTLGLTAGAFCTHLALGKGLSPVTWFFVGLTTNLVGVLLALRQSSRTRVEMRPRLAKITKTVPPLICSACRAQNHPSARQCTGCGSKMQPIMESEVERTGLYESM